MPKSNAADDRHDDDHLHQPPPVPMTPPELPAEPETETKGPKVHGVWRDGDLMVCEENARLPRSCPVTNGKPASSLARITLRYTPGWVYLLIIVCAPAYLAIKFLGLPSMVVVLPYSTKVRKQIEDGKNMRRMGWILIVIGVMTIVLLPILGVVGIVMVIKGMMKANALKVVRLQEGKIWLAGVHRKYLKALEPYPYA